MEARSRACPGEAEEAVAALADKVLSMALLVKFFQFWPLGALNARRRAQAATIPPVTVVPAAARAAPRAVRSLENA